MSDLIAAMYLDISLSLFRAFVEAGHLPEGRRIFGSAVVRWHREALDAVLSREFGRPVVKSVAGTIHDAEDAWERALNAA